MKFRFRPSIENLKLSTSFPEVKLTKEALKNVQSLLEHPEAKKLNIFMNK